MPSSAPVIRSVCCGVATSLMLLALILASWWLFIFDPALLPYAVATVVTSGFLVYRLALWLHRPPTAALLRRGVRGMARPAAWSRLLPALCNYFAINRFVWRRQKRRWLAHWPIMAGCVMAAGIVFPLIFGWIHFQTPGQDFDHYQLVVFGLPTVTFATDGLIASFLFHGLVWASLLVLLGVGMALWRRLRDRGDQAIQTAGNDFTPLILLALISLTGLGLFASYAFFDGAGHLQMVWIHAACVIVTMAWLPYGKLLHVPQRSIKLAHFFAAEAAEAEPAICKRCQRPFATAAQIAELKQIEAALGYRYAIADNDQVDHYQDICPQCRRHLLVSGQGSRWHDSRPAMSLARSDELEGVA